MIARYKNIIQQFLFTGQRSRIGFKRKVRHFYKYKSFTLLVGTGVYCANLEKNEKQTLVNSIGGALRFFRTLRIGIIISFDYFFSMLGLTEGCPNYEVAMSRIHQRAANRILNGCLINGGLYVKMGQGLVAMNHVLPTEYLETLEILHDKTLPRRKDEVVDLFKEDFGVAPNEMFEEFNLEPIAAASLAQVFKAKTKDGLDVAVKVQYIDLQSRFNTDIFTLDVLLKFILIMHPSFNFTWLFKKVKDSLKQELDFVNEGKNAERCAKDLAHLNFIYIPKIIWDKCSRRVLTAEYVDAIKVNDVETLTKFGYSLADIDSKLFRIFGEQIFHTGFVHGDPHPGNVMVKKDKNNKVQIVLLDHGLYNYLPSDYRLALCNFWSSIVLNDHPNMKKYARELGVEDYKTLAVVFTQRPLSPKIVLHSAMTDVEIQQMLKLFREFENVIKTIREMPPSLLFVIRNLNIVRAIARNHGDPINRYTALARIASCGRQEDSSMSVYKRVLSCKKRTYFELRLWFNNIHIWFIKLILQVLYMLGRLPEFTVLSKQIS